LSLYRLSVSKWMAVIALACQLTGLEPRLAGLSNVSQFLGALFAKSTQQLITADQLHTRHDTSHPSSRRSTRLDSSSAPLRKIADRLSALQQDIRPDA
jgi:hypothetical protein